MFLVQGDTYNPHANAYCTRNFVRAYLQARNKVASWESNTTPQAQEAAIILATDYINQRFRFKGCKEFIANRKAYNVINIVGELAVGDVFHVGGFEYTVANDNPGGGGNRIVGLDEPVVPQLVAEINNEAGNDLVTAVAAGENCVLLETAKEDLTGGQIVSFEPNNKDANLAVWILYPTLQNEQSDVVQPLEFPRLQLYDLNGVLVQGIPEKLKQCTAEYAVRVINNPDGLNPDPEYDPSGKDVYRTFDKIGPLETQRNSNNYINFRRYPTADKLLRDYVVGSGGGRVTR